MPARLAMSVTFISVSWSYARAERRRGPLSPILGSTGAESDYAFRGARAPRDRESSPAQGRRLKQETNSLEEWIARKNRRGRERPIVVRMPRQAGRRSDLRRGEGEVIDNERRRRCRLLGSDS